MNAEQSTLDFFHFFRQETNDGHVFNRDRSAVWSDSMTDEDRKERAEWRQVLSSLFEHYKHRRGPQITSLSLLFQQRLSPPILVESDEVVSAESDKHFGRAQLRPSRDGIGEWKNFPTDVENHQPAPCAFHHDHFYELATSFAIREEIWNESSEEHWIVARLGWSLKQAGLGNITHQRTGTVGLPDFQLTEVSTNRATIICESQSTHDLRLPCDAAQVVAMYQAAVCNDHNAPVWSNVCRPLAQLVRYMVDNECRYGALTSATRTYFVRITGSGHRRHAQAIPMVEVSDAWYVGQENYIKAWAFVQHESCVDPDHGISVDWDAFDRCREIPDKHSSLGPDTQPPRGGPDSDPSGSTGKRKRSTKPDVISASLQGASTGLLEHVSLKDIEIISPLGVGLNGTAFKARWKGVDVAMKQFDLNKGGAENFQSELSAYAKLQDVWGELVPKPLFLSESRSGGVQFLGLQLGREYGPSDHVSRDDEQAVRKSIYDRGIDLLDHDGRNFVLVPGKDGTERLVAIDLEDHDVVDAVYRYRGK